MTAFGETGRRGGTAALAGALALAAAALALLPAPAQAKNQPVICESQNYGYKHCSMKTSYGVVLVTQISRGRGECIQGQTWGWDSGGVWVTQGCRASFIQGNWANDYPSVAGGGVSGNRGGAGFGGGSSSSDGDFSLDSLFSALGAGAGAGAGAAATGGGGDFSGGRCYRPQDAVACESRNYGYTRCPMKTSYGVKIVAQMSSGRGECVEGRTWGWDSSGVWVDGGCRGRFIQGNWDACGPTPGMRQAAPAAAAAIPAGSLPWQQNGGGSGGGWRPPAEGKVSVSDRDLAGCRDSLNNYVHQQASRSRRVAIDVERTDARLQGANTVVEETARVSTDFGDGRVSYRCTIAPSGQIIAFDARDL